MIEVESVCTAGFVFAHPARSARDENAKRVGKAGGIAHFGFRLVDPKKIDAAAEAVKEAGGKVLDKRRILPG